MSTGLSTPWTTAKPRVPAAKSPSVPWQESCRRRPKLPPRRPWLSTHVPCCWWADGGRELSKRTPAPVGVRTTTANHSACARGLMSLRALLARLIDERRAETPLSSDDDEPEVRLAIYDSPLSEPQVVSVRGDDFHALVGETAARTYAVSRERGGRVPYGVIREIVENLIHAYFRNATVTVLDDGNTIRISDQGPGIADKVRALQPGFSTATAQMRRIIRGVGSGLPLAKEQLQFLGGTLQIEDNPERGTVVTLSVHRDPPTANTAPARVAERRHLTTRQKKILLLIAELGAAGPTTIAKELDVSHSTAYRELHALETLGLVTPRGRGQRTLTEDGIAFLETTLKA